MSSETARETLEQAMTLAREATNGWACYARTGKELTEIGRIHMALDALAALRAAPAPPTKEWCMAAAKAEEAAGDPDITVGAAPAPEGETPCPCPTPCDVPGGENCKRRTALRKAELEKRAASPSPTVADELPDEFEADGVNYCGHCYQAIEQTPSEQLAAALASDEPEAVPAPPEIEMVRQVLNADLKTASERVLALELEVQRLRAAPAPEGEMCEWTDDPSGWQTGCGRDWQFIDDGPVENRMDYCMGCGKRVRVVASEGEQP
jgi:hypothetical protein